MSRFTVNKLMFNNGTRESYQMSFKQIFQLITTVIVIGCLAGVAMGEDKISVSTSVDLYNRYVWRGLDIANTPSMQPSLSAGYDGFELGVWGAYTLSNQSSVSDEIDFWLSYSREFGDGNALTILATDYYFPNAGPKFFNFNNYDDPNPGAHTVELGLSFSSPILKSLTLSAYMNVYNDEGNNTYFQADYPFKVGETEMGLFCGAAGGSSDNPGYYGTASLNVINLGISARRDIKMSESFSLPLTISLIVNPNSEISYFLAGMSL